MVPGYDAVTSLCKLLELLAGVRRPLSELVAAVPQPVLVRRSLDCPWAKKGLVMRLLSEQLADRRLDLMEGIKAFDDRGWVQALPDPDEPVMDVYAEGATAEESALLADEIAHLVQEIVQGDAAPARTGIMQASS